MESTKEVAGYVVKAYGIRNLSGPRNAEVRQRILHLLTGAKPPKSKAGINLVEAALYKAANVDPNSDCLAVVRRRVDAWAEQTANA